MLLPLGMMLEGSWKELRSPQCCLELLSLLLSLSQQSQSRLYPTCLGDTEIDHVYSLWQSEVLSTGSTDLKGFC